MKLVTARSVFTWYGRSLMLAMYGSGSGDAEERGVTNVNRSIKTLRNVRMFGGSSQSESRTCSNDMLGPTEVTNGLKLVASYVAPVLVWPH